MLSAGERRAFSGQQDVGHEGVEAHRDVGHAIVVAERGELRLPSIWRGGLSLPSCTVLKVAVSIGSKVKRGQHLLITEAMKMETTVQAPFNGVIKEIHVVAGEAISTGDLLIEIEKE